MKNRLLLVSSLATALSAMTAGAIPVNITTDPDGLAPYTAPVSPNSGDASTVNFLKQQISLWNPDPTLSIGSQGVARKDENLTGTTYYILPGYQYVVLKSANEWQAYYVKDGGTVTSPNGKDFSSAVYVPDGGSTVMLLGAALSVIAAARRKFGV